jgi:hypothetical protein
MVAYDSKLLYEFADQLYKEAARLLWTAALGGFLVGTMLGLVLAVGAIALRPDLRGSILSGSTPTIAFAIIGGLMGYSNARQKALLLRVQAQTLLCNAKIEENTRK